MTGNIADAIFGHADQIATTYAPEIATLVKECGGTWEVWHTGGGIFLIGSELEDGRHFMIGHGFLNATRPLDPTPFDVGYYTPDDGGQGTAYLTSEHFDDIVDFVNRYKFNEEDQF